jgi:hypothetical protein
MFFEAGENSSSFFPLVLSVSKKFSTFQNAIVRESWFWATVSEENAGISINSRQTKIDFVFKITS